jgi:hypothetical protein
MVVGVVTACGGDPKGPAQSDPVATPPKQMLQPAVEPTSANALSGALVVVKASGSASRGLASPRILRRIVAARRGLIELAHGYTEVNLMVKEVVSGPIDDPDYANRPVGTNRLSVVLTDEAAFAAPKSLDGFAGIWRLTRLADGTLVASAIEDTPFSPESVAARRATIVNARQNLRAPLPEQRLAGLDALEQHAFFELVPDVIALLADTRVDGQPRLPGSHDEGPRVVGDVALAALRKLVAPLADEAIPAGRTSDAWDAYWKNLTTRVSSAPAIAPTTTVELARLAMPQSWPDLVATPAGFVLGVSRLNTAIEGHVDGIAVMAAPFTKRTWISSKVAQGIEAALGPAGIGVVHGEYEGPWQFTVVPPRLAAAPKSSTVIAATAKASHVALAASDRGFLLVSIAEGASSLVTYSLDPQGRPRGKRTLALPTPPSASYHRGVHPVALARRAAGWLAVVETSASVLVANIDDSSSLVGTTQLGDSSGIAQPKLAVSQDRALVVWTRDSRTAQLASVLVDLTGKPTSAIVTTGTEVNLVSQPVALEDGEFAVAWLEAGTEVHVGRWNRAGERVANVVVQARDAAAFALTLSRDGNALLITFEDTSRYPYVLVGRRIDLNVLR